MIILLPQLMFYFSLLPSDTKLIFVEKELSFVKRRRFKLAKVEHSNPTWIYLILSLPFDCFMQYFLLLFPRFGLLEFLKLGSRNLI